MLEVEVIGTSGKNTLAVEKVRRIKHPVYGKYVLRRKKMLVHCMDESKYSKGDKITIIETRPISKRKSWKVKID